MKLTYFVCVRFSKFIKQQRQKGAWEPWETFPCSPFSLSKFSTLIFRKKGKRILEIFNIWHVLVLNRESESRWNESGEFVCVFLTSSSVKMFFLHKMKSLYGGFRWSDGGEEEESTAERRRKKGNNNSRHAIHSIFSPSSTLQRVTLKPWDSREFLLARNNKKITFFRCQEKKIRVRKV